MRARTSLWKDQCRHGKAIVGEPEHCSRASCRGTRHHEKDPSSPKASVRNLSSNTRVTVGEDWVPPRGLAGHPHPNIGRHLPSSRLPLSASTVAGASRKHRGPSLAEETPV